MVHYQKVINDYNYKEAYHFLNKLPEYYCPNFEAGCKNLYNSAMECIDHIEDCTFTKVNCPYMSCSEDILIIDVEYHLKNTHPELFWELVACTNNFYNIVCKDCKEVLLEVHRIHFDTGYRKDFNTLMDQECEEHVKSCTFRKVNCPDVSCSENIMIKDVTNHLENVHPETLWKKSPNNFGIAYDMKFLGEKEDDQTWPLVSIKTTDGSTFFTAAKIIGNNLYFWLNLFGSKPTAANYEVSYSVRSKDNKIFGKVDKVNTLDEKANDIINKQAAFVISKDQILKRCLGQKMHLLIEVNILCLTSYVLDEYDFDCDGYHPRLEKPRLQVVVVKSQKLFLKKDPQANIVDDKSVTEYTAEPVELAEVQGKKLPPQIWAVTDAKTWTLRFWIADLLNNLYGDGKDLSEDDFE